MGGRLTGSYPQPPTTGRHPFDQKAHILLQPQEEPNANQCSVLQAANSLAVPPKVHEQLTSHAGYEVLEKPKGLRTRAGAMFLKETALQLLVGCRGAGKGRLEQVAGGWAGAWGTQSPLQL